VIDAEPVDPGVVRDGGLALRKGLQLTASQVELLKRTVCRGATDDELGLFIEVCKRTRLDPFTKQIHAVKRRMRNPETGEWEDVMVHQTGIDGYRLTGQRSGEYGGQTPPAWCGVDGQWTDIWLSEDPPNAAKVGVYRQGIAEPFVGIARYDAYVQKTADGAPAVRWQSDPSGMLAKCAEAQALRKAFPNELSGIYTDEEMQQADMMPDTPRVQTPGRASEAATPPAAPAPPKAPEVPKKLESPLRGVVAKVTQKSGGPQDDRWTKYDVHVAQVGQEKTHRLATFSKSLAEVAKGHAKTGEEVDFAFEITEKGHYNLRGIETVGADPEKD
jgi:phage recombination protein Bet